MSNSQTYLSLMVRSVLRTRLEPSFETPLRGLLRMRAEREIVQRLPVTFYFIAAISAHTAPPTSSAAQTNRKIAIMLDDLARSSSDL